MASSRRLPVSYDEATYDSAGGKDYTSLATWEDATDTDLVTATKGKVLTCYSGIHNDSVTLAGATTNSSYFRVIRAVAGSRGTPTDGVRFVKTSATNFSIFYVAENYVALHDIAVKCTNTSSSAGSYCTAFSLYATYISIVGCIAYDCVANSSTTSYPIGFFVFNSNNITIVNSVAIGMDGGASSVNTAGFYFYNTGVVGSTLYMYNCVSSDNEYAGVIFYRSSSSYAQTVNSKNCISQGNTNQFLDTGGANATTHNQTTNATSGVTFAADGYHLASNDTGAIGDGTDLSADGTFAFDDDIDGDTRDDWDIGCDEYVSSATNIEVNATIQYSTFSQPTPTITAKIPNVTVQATLQTFIANLITSTVNAIRNTAVSVAILAATFSSVSPSVSANTNIIVSPNNEEATFSAVSPVVSTIRNQNISVEIQSASFTVVQPSLSYNDNEEVACGVQETTLYLIDPVVSGSIGIINIEVNAEIQSATFSDIAPVINTTKSISLSPEILEVIFNQPDIIVSTIRNTSFSSDVQIAQFSNPQPSLTYNDNEEIAIGISSVQFSIPSPIILAIRNISVGVSIQETSFSLLNPVIEIHNNESVSIEIQSVSFTNLNPVISTTRFVEVSSEIQSGTFSIIQPTIQTGGNIEIPISIQYAAFSQPELNISAIRNISIKTEIIEATFNQLESLVSASADIPVNIGYATFNLLQPIISANNNEEISVDIITASFSQPSAIIATATNINSLAGVQTAQFSIINPVETGIDNENVLAGINSATFSLINPTITTGTNIEYASNKPLLIDSIGGKVLQLGGNKMPTWNTAGRPTGKTGLFGFNTETSKLEVYANDTWNIIN